MTGHHGGRQDRLFDSFNLDDYVPRTHLLRGIDRFFDLSELATTSHRSKATPVVPLSTRS